MGHQPVIVHAGVALIDRQRIIAVTLANLGEPVCHQREGFVPLNRLPLVAYPAHRVAQAIRIVLDVLQRDGLGADVTTTETVLRVALDRYDLLITGFDGQAANGLAQVTGTVVLGRFAHRGLQRLFL